MSDCKHEWEPYPTEPIFVTDEEWRKAGVFADFTPDRVVGCKLCNAPIDRGRFDLHISHPALRNRP